ncbi:MAG: gamma-glutamylcyclotransferase [Puniceicoccaceae bacterium]
MKRRRMPVTIPIDWFDDPRVFVYGTLKPGGLYWPRFCAGRVRAVRGARVRGRLYDLDAGYPALRIGGTEWVRGVVLDLAGPEVLRGIDRLEGFEPGRAEDRNEYNRRRTEAFDPGGEALGCVWTYEMDLRRIEASGGRLIPEGVWGA